jgi:peptidyl-tRNA hydrolase
MDPPGARPEDTPEDSAEDRPEDSAEEGPDAWAMQVVVHAEKTGPPARSAVCAAAATAVARVLTTPDPGWQEAVRRWEAGPIRKVTRRARGVRWTAVQRLPGVTVECAGAEVRAFVPAPVTRLAPELSRLQVAGLDLTDDPDAPAAPPQPPYAAISVNPHVRMSTGKAAAQCGHAAHLLVRQAPEPGRSAWIAAGSRAHLVRAEAWRDSVARAAVAVRDAGWTEVPPGTMTAVARIVTSLP